MTEEHAIEIMKKVNPVFNMMTEYKTGYLFWLKDGPETIGGPNEPAAVLKKDGSIVPMARFVMMGGADGKEISEHPVDLK